MRWYLKPRPIWVFIFPLQWHNTEQQFPIRQPNISVSWTNVVEIGTLRERERSTHAAGLRRRDIFTRTSFLPLFFSRVQGTKRTNQEQRLYTQRSVKTRLSIVRVVWMRVNGMLVWTWVTDYSVCLCECVLCACLNRVRFSKCRKSAWDESSTKVFYWLLRSMKQRLNKHWFGPKTLSRNCVRG